MGNLAATTRWRTKCGNCAHFITGKKFNGISCRQNGRCEGDRSCQLWKPDLSRMRMPVLTLVNIIKKLPDNDFAKLESYALGNILEVPVVKMCASCWWFTRKFRGNSCREAGIFSNQCCDEWTWDHEQAQGLLKDALKIFDNLLPAEKPAVQIIVCRERESRHSHSGYSHGDEVIYEIPDTVKERVTVVDFPYQRDEGAVPVVRVMTEWGKIWTVLSHAIRPPRPAKQRG